MEYTVIYRYIGPETMNHLRQKLNLSSPKKCAITKKSWESNDAVSHICITYQFFVLSCTK